MLAPQHISRSIRSCRGDDSLQRVAEVMWKHDRNFLVIVDTSGCPIGMITDHQLFLAARQHDKPLAHIRVSDVVSQTYVAKRPAQSRQRPTRQHAHLVPIFDVEGSLVNIVGEQWLARYLRELGSPGVIWHPEWNNNQHLGRTFRSARMGRL